MTTTQSFKIYEILQRHFQSNDDTKVVVQEIEQIIEDKIDNKSNILATKGDSSSLKEDLASLKQDMLKFQIDVEKRFNSIIIWIVGTGIGITALLFSMISIFLIK